MTQRRGATPNPPGQPSFAEQRLCLFLCVVALLGAGCGVPGDPAPPSPPIPLPVTDLTAAQRGDGVLLTFTLPTKSTRSERLTETPTMEILRGSLRPDGLTDTRSFRLVDTVPGPLLSSYVQQGKVEFLEPVPAEETRTSPGKMGVYRVRTRVSERKVSPDSNDATLVLYPVPERIKSVETQVTERAIELRWTPPAQTSAGDPLPPIAEFHVLRGELDPASQAAAEKDLHDAVWKMPLLQIVTTKAPEYQDSGFDYGKTYVYVVRTEIIVNGTPVESGDSRPAILTPKDIFPPAAPQDLVAAVLPGASPGTNIIDLSWAINSETDLAGYRVYRSERENEQGQSLTPNLLPSPAYRDSGVLSGRRYWYTVTAVDRAGNESSPSTPVLVEVP